MSRALILFARAPSLPGKTRLTAHLSAEAAGSLRRAIFLDTLEIAGLVGAPVTVCYTPDEAHDELQRLVAGRAALAPQRGDNLGRRMSNAVTSAFDEGVRDVVIVGSDVPTLPHAYVRDAFTALAAGVDCVFGPSDDGGYYLVGVSGGRWARADAASRVEPIFRGIEWGTAAVLTSSLAAADAAGLTTTLVGRWYDVDTPADLARVGDTCTDEVASHTRRWLAQHPG